MKYIYWVQGLIPTEMVYTREEILAANWKEWKAKMEGVDADQDMIIEENCIEDWMVMNHAYPLSQPYETFQEMKKNEPIN